MINSNLKIALTKALIVLVPTYSVAFLTEQMIYVVPMLAASGFFASHLDVGRDTTQRNLDDQDGDPEQDSDGDLTPETSATGSSGEIS